MTRERFKQLVAEALDKLPKQFRARMHNVVVLVEDYPPEQRRASRLPRPRNAPRPALVMGHFIGTALTEKSVFDQPTGPDQVVLYQKNIEKVCRTEREIKREVLLTVMHEVGHYFGMDEEQLSDV